MISHLWEVVWDLLLVRRLRELLKKPVIIDFHWLFLCHQKVQDAEGIGLNAMKKTSAVLKRLGEKRVPYISVLCDPTTGGTAASLAMLGDVILAEPNALISFAGPRVIEQTIRQKLPKGFQRSEFLLEHGMIDRVVDRNDLRDTLAELVAALDPHFKKKKGARKVKK